MVAKRRGSALPRTTPTLPESYPSGAIGKKQGPADGGGQPLDDDPLTCTRCGGAADCTKRSGNSKGPEPILWSPGPLPLIVSGGRTSSVPSSFREFIYYKSFQNRLVG